MLGMLEVDHAHFKGDDQALVRVEQELCPNGAPVPFACPSGSPLQEVTPAKGWGCPSDTLLISLPLPLPLSYMLIVPL